MDMELAEQQPGDAEDPVVPTGAATEVPQTGDESIDDSLRDLAAAQAGSLSERIAAGERTHGALQSRLSDLGGA